MNNEEYVQKLGAKLLTNEHVLSSLNTSFILYIQTEAGKSLANTHASLP